jgi:hypothetical protein
MIDFLGHVAYGLAVLLPAAFGHFWLAAIVLGLVRELEQMRAAGDWALGTNRLTDIAGFAVVGIILQIVRACNG